jgi:ABC-2 type transport system permease protein/lipopolysaccharide transport system permease protein
MTLLEAPPPDILFRRRINLIRSARACWGAREVVLTVAQRDFIARYKQASLGVLWAVFTPLAMMLVFTLVFTRVANVDTGGAPYSLFAYLGLLPWTFFSTAVSQGSLSLVTNAQLLNRTAFPREVFPLASVCVALVDMVIATAVLGLLFAITGFAPAITSLWVPLILVIQIAYAAAFATGLSAIVVYFRDLRHAIPVLLQLGIFAAPVAYGVDVIPETYRPLYCALIPIAPVIDSYRRVVLEGSSPAWGLLGIGALSTALMLAVGYHLFKRLEGGMVDLA